MTKFAPPDPPRSYTAAHWGIYEVTADTEGAPVLSSWAEDTDPAHIGFNRLDADLNRTRVERPAIRRGWLEKGPGPADGSRGRDDFVEVDWNTAFDLVAAELDRVRTDHGNEAIYGGSYGWASAGRFHHAQSQIHRFLNLIGGYVSHRDTYSLGAGRVLMPHIVAPMDALMAEHTSWEDMARHTELFIAFGGVPSKNAQISSGGASEHRTGPGLRAMGAAGTRFVNIGPVDDNLNVGGDRRWIPLRPNTDTALMLALAHTLYSEDIWNKDFVDRYCTGFDRFLPYLLGETDGTPKTPSWAFPITGVSPGTIRELAHDMARHRTMLNAAWALQRAAHGEQPFWMVVTLASMLGQIGLPGGGFAMGYGTTNAIGSPHPLLPGPTLPQGRNPVQTFIPVARVADMLLNPGAEIPYDGQTLTYPDIRLIYWAGGNPFHHHQDLRRLSDAWQCPDTIITHEQFWTANARMADIVLPTNLSIERNDIGYAKREGVLVAMRAAIEPHAETKADFDIFRGLSARLGIAAAFDEGRDEMAWLEQIYDACRAASGTPSNLPSFTEFWEAGLLDFRSDSRPAVLLAAFRSDPEKHALTTPSGLIEIFSQTIANFGYDDCPGHPVWREPFEWLGGDLAKRWPLHLLSDQPRYRLHSQLDHGAQSRKGKRDGREQVYLNPADAAPRGIFDGDLVELRNDRGRCLATATLTALVMPGVMRLATGAWYDPASDTDGAIETHGNPNALTLDRGASKLSQGCSAQTCLANIHRYVAAPPPIRVFERPELFPYDPKKTFPGANAKGSV